MGDKVIPVKVCVRIRPLVPKETRAGCQSAVEVVDGEPQVSIPTMEKSWTYDYAMGGDKSNGELYREAVSGIVKELYKGYNVTVLAYGQTGSGKTHSMGTAYNTNVAEEMEGIIPRAVRDMFDHINSKSDTEHSVKVSFVELYNEQLYDLLSSKERREDSVVEIREDGKGGIKVPGLTEAPASSMHETMKLLEKASDGRVTAATAMNQTSSRSHAIFTVSLESKPKGSAGSGVVSKFHLVDLAGSERPKKTQAKGERMKEGININMGLLALGNVISALGDESRAPGSYIPYRDSKLTRLLQDSLGGNSHTCMIACVSPADTNIEETVSTLRYADRARKIKNKPIVNHDPKAQEMAKLKAELQDLRLKLAGGVIEDKSGTVRNDTEEAAKLKTEIVKINEEKLKLSSALSAALGESAITFEKLLLSEQANDKLNGKLNELASQLEEAAESHSKAPLDGSQAEGRAIFSRLKSKVEEVQDYQKMSEKSIMEHEILSRIPNANTATNLEESGDANFDENSRALKQSELAKQLVDLNNALATKQDLLSKAGDNDTKLKKYEETIKSMEVEIGKLQQEKEELTQLQRSNKVHDATGKLSEVRRKKITDLEKQINDLKLKQKEHQKLMKINSQTEAKAAKYQEEIRMMKVAKVKLVKQIKEESEKMRIYKANKEKEVIQLKNADRKTKAEMAKMNQVHERRENVLKRKMEETSAVNKRLKDALAKKESVRAMKNQVGKEGIRGAGERVRGLVKSEIDIVVTVKEAEVAKVNLLAERKELNREVENLNRDMRQTMTSKELELLTSRQEELKRSLELRNAQLNELQKQILSAEQDREKSTNDRWERVTSMVEAKLAIQYLFDTATESLAESAARKAEMNDLAMQVEEGRQLKKNHAEEIATLRLKHEDSMVRLEREHEEKVLFLLRQLPGQVDPETKDLTLGSDISMMEERLAFQTKELEKMSEMHDELQKKDQEIISLKTLAMSNGSILMPAVKVEGPANTTKNTTRRTKTATVQRYDEDEFFNEMGTDSDLSTDDDAVSDDDDPEWRKTPMFDRIKKARRSLGAPMSMKRKRRVDPTLEKCSEEEESEGKDELPSKRKSSLQRCSCKSSCKTKACPCKKAGPFCTSLCGCVSSKCANKEIPGTDVSSAVESEKENDDLSPKKDVSLEVPSVQIRTPLKNTENTKQLIFKTPTSADMFAEDSDHDVELTPMNK